MALTVGVDEGRAACAASVEAFCAAAEGCTEHELLGASRCHGWTRLDLRSPVVPRADLDLTCGPCRR